MDDDDDTLADAWRRGDTLAGERLYDRYFARISRFFRHKLPDEAEDLIQQTFMALIEARPRMRSSTSFRAYLFGIAHNVLRARLRALARERAFDPIESSFEQVAPRPSEVLIEGDERQRMLRALRRLPFEHQVVLELHYWEELSAAEIAESLGVPPSTLRSRLARARALLEQALEQLEARGE